jgi:putative heme-binding domain-containing protein
LNRDAVQKSAALALTQSQEGAVRLLAAQKDGTLSTPLAAVVGPALRSARWPEVRAAALVAFPATSSATAPGELPPVAELLQMTGDPQKGLAIFRRPEVACSTCHQVNGEGVDFGPKLSEIGSKLGKDALIASILEPSAGISFGFEAWRVELKNGDEVFGLIVSDAEDEVEVKQQGGQSQRVKKADIATREKQTLSIMPAGLHQSLTAQEFVDLIAYLSSLKKVEPRQL